MKKDGRNYNCCMLTCHKLLAGGIYWDWQLADPPIVSFVYKGSYKVPCAAICRGVGNQLKIKI